MTQTFTKQLNDVVRYVYNETSKKEDVEIEESLARDVNLLDFYLDSLNIKAEMEKIKMVPSDQSISKILAYSRKTSPVL
ncbi:MAG: peptidyl-tRNA hydrolase [Arcticibacterium sp.]|jgi:peptidyl-tRNA hydrolase